ncbi:Flp pilus assembly complex ATPase component TadA [bacterium]|nr:Flp pilus assembly complex ATPase component TadA [bacterium]
MIKLVIKDKLGDKDMKEFSKDEVTIGRTADNDLFLERKNISKLHAKIIAKNGKLFIKDMGSTNGTLVNEAKIDGVKAITPADIISVGDFLIKVKYVAEESESSVASDTSSEDEAAKRRSRRRRGSLDDIPDELSEDKNDLDIAPKKGEEEKKTAPPVMMSEEEKMYISLQQEIHDRLIDYLDLRRLKIDELEDSALRNKTEDAIKDIIEQMDQTGEIPHYVNQFNLLRDVLNEALGLGPLEEFLADESISEIMVNHANQIYIEQGGKLTLSPKKFSSNKAVLGVIERIVAPIGRRIDESSPLVDARLKDGSRVNAIIPPLALKGPCITIRKFKKEKLGIEDLIKYNSLSKGMAQFLKMCVLAHKNIFVSGGTGSGKTTTLNIISSFIPEDERIVTIEDAAELQMRQPHVVSLESRPANIEGKGAISIRELVKNSLRMRPDRIVIGECRGGEALDMLQAMNTGHDGSMTTGHANTPRDMISRLETMVLMSGMDLPIRAIREQIASAVNIIVQIRRYSDGSRKITNITEVTGMEVDIITLQDIFYYQQEGFDEKGKVKGKYVATGFIPKFYEDLQRKGIAVDMDIFR